MHLDAAPTKALDDGLPVRCPECGAHTLAEPEAVSARCPSGHEFRPCADVASERPRVKFDTADLAAFARPEGGLAQ